LAGVAAGGLRRRSPHGCRDGPDRPPTGGLRDATTAVGGRRGCRRKPARRPVTGCQLRRRRRQWRAAWPPLPRRGGNSGGAGASGDKRWHLSTGGATWPHARRRAATRRVKHRSSG